MTMFPFSTLAGIICDSGAASITFCHVFVELGMTKPNSKNHSSMHRPLNKTFCSIRNFSIGSTEEKLISLDTARHRRTLLGTLASCSTSGKDRSSLASQSDSPLSASRNFIQLILKPCKISSALDGMISNFRTTSVQQSLDCSVQSNFVSSSKIL